jgi:hypothetical protein
MYLSELYEKSRRRKQWVMFIADPVRKELKGAHGDTIVGLLK